jgi:hypothetical protein
VTATSRRLPWLQRLKLRLINIYPPFLGAGIRVRWGDDGRLADVRLKLHWWNRNFVGVHFGGSLYALTDPFFVLLLMRQIGWDYIVWNKGAEMLFLKPGRGTLHAHFDMPPNRVEAIRQSADENERVEPVFTVEVKDEAGDVVARVDQTLYVRRKRQAEPT